MKNPNNLIILGCANEMICESRMATIPEILKNFPEKTEIILSGGDPIGNGKTEAEKMKNFIENLIIPHDFSLHLEDQSMNTSANIRNSLELILDRNLEKNNTFILTNDFHTHRTNRLTEYILKTEFFGRLNDLCIQTLATENFFNEENYERFFNHPLWKPTIENFEIGENRGRLSRTEKLIGKPTFEQERNKLISIMYRQKMKKL